MIVINSIERVKAALKFENPDKVPIWKAFEESDVFFMSRIPSRRWQPGHDESEKGLFPHLGSDIIVESGLWKWDMPDWAKNNPNYEKNRWLKINREEIDEWGNIWKRAGIPTMGHPGRATLLDYSKMNDYFNKYTPIFDDEHSYSLFLKLKNVRGKNKYRMCNLEVGPFQMASQMRGFETFLMDHFRHKREIKRLLDYITDQYVKFENMWIKVGAEPHGFVLYDDLGDQKGSFFNPKTFKEFYEPVYKRLIDRAHELGCEFHLHCCGKINRIMPILIEWGLDAIELDSPRTTGYPNLNEFRGKLMIWACVNIQSIYNQGTSDECEREVWHMMRNLGTPNGGFGAYFYPQEDHIQVPRENAIAFQEGLNKYGVYQNIPSHWWTYPIAKEWNPNIVPPLPPMND